MRSDTVILVAMVSIFALVIPIRGQDEEWCNWNCPDSKNTLCMYGTPDSTDDCSTITESMTDETKNDMLVAHNTYRNEFAAGYQGWPPAANMRYITWDDNLEALAQRWADQCIPGHDKCRRTPDFEQSGQNYLGAAGDEDPPSAKDSFHAWTDEINDASTDLVDNYQFGIPYGHFSQVVWAESYKIGCGEITYTKYDDDDNYRATVCDFGPSGNYGNVPMYLRGEPCSQCPAGTECYPASKYPNLCATPEESQNMV